MRCRHSTATECKYIYFCEDLMGAHLHVLISISLQSETEWDYVCSCQWLWWHCSGHSYWRLGAGLYEDKVIMERLWENDNSSKGEYEELDVLLILIYKYLYSIFIWRQYSEYWYLSIWTRSASKDEHTTNMFQRCKKTTKNRYVYVEHVDNIKICGPHLSHFQFLDFICVRSPSSYIYL